MGAVAYASEIDCVTLRKTEHCELVCDSLKNTVEQMIHARPMASRG